MKQYEIWMADLNPQIGTEAGKIRPVVIVQTDLLNNVHPSIIVCPVTSQLQPSPNPLRVSLTPGKISGLQKKSDIMVDQVRAIDNKRLVKRIGTVDTNAILTLKIYLKRIMDL